MDEIRRSNFRKPPDNDLGSVHGTPLKVQSSRETLRKSSDIWSYASIRFQAAGHVPMHSSLTVGNSIGALSQVKYFAGHTAEETAKRVFGRQCGKTRYRVVCLDRIPKCGACTSAQWPHSGEQRTVALLGEICQKIYGGRESKAVPQPFPADRLYSVHRRHDATGTHKNRIIGRKRRQKAA